MLPYARERSKLRRATKPPSAKELHREMGKKGKAPAKASRPSSIKSLPLTEASAAKLTRCHESDYDAQLAQKLAAVKALLPQAKDAQWETHASPKTAFRLRCNFQMWHESEGANLHYVMYDGDNAERTPLRVEDFPRGCAETQRLMPLVLEALRGDDVLRDKVHEVRYHTTLHGSTVVVLVYNRPIDDDKVWRSKAEALAKTLKVVLVGRSSKVRITLNGDAPRVREQLRVAGADYTLFQLEGEFSQPNGRVCEKMVTWAVERTAASANDLLELYCGNGNFTIPLSKNFRKVLATEVSKANTECARDNLKANDIKNVQFARLNAKETSEALAPGARPFKRMTEARVDPSTLKLETLFVQPGDAERRHRAVKSYARRQPRGRLRPVSLYPTLRGRRRAEEAGRRRFILRAGAARAREEEVEALRRQAQGPGQGGWRRQKKGRRRGEEGAGRGASRKSSRGRRGEIGLPSVLS